MTRSRLAAALLLLATPPAAAQPPEPREGPQAAAEPAQRLTVEAAKDFWSFRPVREPEVPPVRDASWPLTPIDRFLLARLEERGLRPVGDADRRTLIRRATFDLTGLPPSPEEVDAFVRDPDPLPQAFGKVVERLLASPHYGERWGRHWMDLVRYADTAGDNSDYPVPQLYRYRNYVIDSFNRDKPYDRFLREQVAGDLLPAATPAERDEQVVATGYVALARRFGSVVEGYPWHLTIEDTIDNLGRTVLGLTVNCARCHDHKFDPISQKDYYALYGIFESTRYPWPGIELDKKPRDLVPLASADHDPPGLAYAVADKPEVGDAKLQIQGDPKRPGETVPRGFLEVLGGQELPPGEAAKSSGRLQLARWLTDPANPLTARVMANRVWHYHFGKGIVKTPSDFGVRGAPPTHPELLDWLAARFVAGGWSVKELHRLILRSRAYMLSAAESAENLAADPDNDLHWRFDRRRLDAETIRDTLLALGGNLDRSVTPGPHPFPPAEKWNFTQHYPFKDDYPTDRRSVYLMTKRLNALPFFVCFDGADRNASTPARDSSVTSVQALYLLNDPFVHDQAARFAARLLRERPGDEAARVRRAFELALARPPRGEETGAALAFLARVRGKLVGSDPPPPPAEAERRAWESYARVLFRLNEFIYVD